MIVAALFLAALVAFAVSAVAGGGAGLVLVPLLRAIIPIAGVPAALSIGTAASSVSRILLFRRAIRWDVVARFLPTALPAAALGAWLLTLFEPAYVEFILALFLIANLPALFRRAGPGCDRPIRPMSPRRLPLLGAAAGLLSGFTGAVGLIFNGAYRRLGLSPTEIVATRATNEVLLHLLKIALYVRFGLVTRPVLAAGLLVAVAAILAAIVVRRLLPLIDEALFRRVGQVAMVAAGIAMFALSGTQIARLHDAWIAHVAPGGEHEVQLHLGGRQRYAVEFEPEGHVVVERSVPFATLSPPSQAAVRAIAAPHEITLIEEVRGPAGISHEVYFSRGGTIHKREIGGRSAPR
jgi:uncharacterized membrane protein YfcA